MVKYITKKEKEIIREFYKKHKKDVETVTELTKEFVRLNPEFLEKEQSIRQNFYRFSSKDINESKSKSSRTNKFEETIEESKDSKTIEQKTDIQITSLEQAIEFFKVDINKWEVTTWKCKSWGTSMKLEEIKENGKKKTTPITKTNYLVSVTLKKKVKDVNYEEIKKLIDNWKIKPIKLYKEKGRGIGVVTVADIHLGLKTSRFNGVVSTPEYSVEIAIDSLKRIAEKINQLNYEEVHLILLGDLVESVTGFNHLETLKEMEYGITGGNIIILGYEVILKFIQSIKNIKKVYVISGNHDRLTPDKRMDLDGGAAQIISYMLGKHIDIMWHPMIMNIIIDNISYILTHGHLGIGKQDIGKIILQYGKQDLYNVFLEAHFHHRKIKKIVHNENLTIVDTTKYRAITVPSVVTGNKWSESMGFGSTPGFVTTEANDNKTNINFFDYSL
jgi:hypothetical protein